MEGTIQNSYMVVSMAVIMRAVWRPPESIHGVYDFKNIKLIKQRFCRGDKFQYRFEKRLNYGEWSYKTVLKRTRGTNTHRESKY